MPLPLTDTISSADLRGLDSITFDPLGVAAVLNNPRADLSAARLYVQSDRRAFRWPHTTMIGGEYLLAPNPYPFTAFYKISRHVSGIKEKKLTSRS